MHQLMPKAPDDAPNLHHSVPDRQDTHALLAAALTCPKTGAACPALAALFGGLSPAGEEAEAWVRALAPCHLCRVSFESDRDQLRRMRLGQREREVLCAAATMETLVLTEPGMTRSLSASRRRAGQNLVRAGLMAPAVAPQRETGRSPRAAVALTPLGRHVLAAYGRFLLEGKPVRWTRPARGAALPGRDPADLRDEARARTEGALRETLAELKSVLIAAIGRPLKDPGLLDTITRRLESKANLLKAVLEPARSAPRPRPATADHGG